MAALGTVASRGKAMASAPSLLVLILVKSYHHQPPPAIQQQQPVTQERKAAYANPQRLQLWAVITSPKSWNRWLKPVSKVSSSHFTNAQLKNVTILVKNILISLVFNAYVWFLRWPTLPNLQDCPTLSNRWKQIYENHITVGSIKLQWDQSLSISQNLCSTYFAFPL